MSSEAEAPRRETRNAALFFAYQAVGAIFTAGLTIFLVRQLGSDGYGIFALATGIGAIVVILSDVGISQASARFLAENADDDEAVRHIVRDALVLKIVLATAVTVLLFLLAGPIANAYDEPALASALRIVAIAVLGQSIMFLGLAFFEATGRNEGALLLGSAESFTETASSIVLVLLGAGVTGAVAGRAVGFGVGAALALWLILRMTPARAGATTRRGSHTRKIVNYALALSVIDGVMTLFTRLDVLLTGAYLGAGSAGIFEAPLRLTMPLQYVGNAIASGFAPRLAGGGSREGVAAFQVGLRWLLVFQFFATTMIVVWATPIVALTLGPEFDESADVLRALGPYVLLSGLGALLAMTVNYMGEARRRVPIALGCVLVNLAIDMILIPRIGVVAGAIGSGVAMAIFVPAHVHILRARIDISLRPSAITTLRAALAAALSAIPHVLAGTDSLSALEWVWGGTAALAAYVAALIVLREVSPAELRAAGGFLAARIGRG
jgi:O-antigen/teichoic acid export membrane protein